MITNVNMSRDAKMRYTNIVTLDCESTSASTVLWSAVHKIELIKLQVRCSTVQTGTTVIQLGTAADPDAYATLTVPNASAAGTLLVVGQAEATRLIEEVVAKNTPLLLSTDGAGTGSVQAIIGYCNLDEDRMALTNQGRL